jgi:aminobenzoyl-glutamate utilization protein A
VDVIARRRQLHSWPEVGFTEFFTSTTIISTLLELGYSVRWGAEANDLGAVLGLPARDELEQAAHLAVQRGADQRVVETLDNGGTGVVAELQGRRPGPTTALRFDMDALPVQESAEEEHLPAREGFRSEREGYMHACGHDGHVAIGLALAEQLADREFPGTVRLIFQAAEEGARGAAPLVKGGAVLAVDRLLSLHLGLDLPAGTVAAASTGFYANSKLEAHFTGRAAHAAAAPDQGRNALLAAANALLMIHAIPRFGSARTRVNVGLLHGGTSPNIIAERARMMLEVRSTDGEVNLELARRVRNVMQGAAAMQEVDVSIEEIGRATTAPCDPELVADVAEAAKTVRGFDSVVDVHDVGVSEDVTLLMREVQGNGGKADYLVVGASNPGPHHNPRFDVAEEVLPPAVELFDSLVRRA